MIHIWIFLFFVALFSLFFWNGFLLYGDFATTFSINGNYLFNNFVSIWLSNSFLWYDATYYTVLRIPYYFLNDVFHLVFWNHYYIFFIAFIYFFRYFFLYLLLRYMKISQVVAIIVSFLYAINFYFIDRLGHTLISFSSIVIPLLIFSYLRFIESNQKKYLVILLLSLSILFTSMHVTLMTIYFFFFFFLFLLIENFRNWTVKKFLLSNIVIFWFFLLSFSYIFVPIIYLKLHTISDIISQVSVYANDWIYNLWKYTFVYNTLYWLWFYASELLNYPLITTFWAILWLIWLWIITFKKDKSERFFLFYFFVFLFFTFLSSLSLNYNYIDFLKSHLLWFSWIKDPAYFLLYVTFTFFVLLWISINSLKKNIYIKIFAVFSLSFMVLVNMFSLYYFKVYTVSAPPPSYYEIDNYLHENDRILVLPLSRLSKFNWSKEVMSGFFNVFLSKYNIVWQDILEWPNLDTQKFIDGFISCFSANCSDIKDYIKHTWIKSIVDFHNAKDVSSSLDSVEDLNYNLQIWDLIKGNVIKKLVDNKDYTIYSVNEKFRHPLVWSDNLVSQKVNFSKYHLQLHNIFGKQDITFFDSFHPEWKLYLQSNQNVPLCKPIETYKNQWKKNIDCEYTHKFFEWEELSYLYKTSLFDSTHKMVYDYANWWTISKAGIISYVNQNYSSELATEWYPKSLANWKKDYKYYTLNPDGSIDVELTLYFKPQSYFYLGLIISWLTFILLVWYLDWDFLMNRRKKENLLLDNTVVQVISRRGRLRKKEVEDK